MTRHDLTLSVNPPATLQDVMDRIAAREDLSEIERRDLRSAVRTVAVKMVGLPAAAVALDVPKLRRVLEDAQPGALGVSPRRLANLRSLFVRALIEAGAEVEPLRLETPLSPDWAALRDALPGRGERNVLARFMTDCAARGIAPGDVDDAVVADYAERLATRSFVRNARKHVQTLVRSWNRSVGAVAGWPLRPLEPLRSRETVLLPAEAFPQRFVRDLDAWCARLGGDDPFEERAFRPLRPVSVKSRRETLRRCASILVLHGRDPATIAALADLVEPDAVRTVLRHHWDRAGGKASWTTHVVGDVLRAVARHHVALDADAFDRLDAIVRRGRMTGGGMTTKNRETLRLFEEERLVGRLLDLPDRLMRRALRDAHVGRRDALSAQHAAAIAILICAPIRMENLVNVRLDKHVIRHGSGRRRETLLSFAAHEVKNDQAIELPLSEEAVRLLDRYLERARPTLAGPGNPFLFPGEADGPRSKTGFGMGLTRTVARELGVKVTPHQFRHVLGFLYLKASPGDHETVRALLGHKSLQTTVRFYAGMEGAEAARRFDEVVMAPRRPRGRRARR